MGVWRVGRRDRTVKQTIRDLLYIAEILVIALWPALLVAAALITAAVLW